MSCVRYVTFIFVASLLCCCLLQACGQPGVSDRSAETQLQELQQQIKGLHKQVQQLENLVEKLQRQLSDQQWPQQKSAQHAQITEFQTKLQGMQLQIDLMDTRIGRLGQLEGRVRSLEMQVSR